MGQGGSTREIFTFVCFQICFNSGSPQLSSNAFYKFEIASADEGELKQHGAGCRPLQM